MRRLRTTGVLLAAGLLAVACSSSSNSGSGTSSTASGTTVTISNEINVLVVGVLLVVFVVAAPDGVLGLLRKLKWLHRSSR